jgi:DNA modification methylase
MKMDYRIINGDCREAMKTLPDQSVQCIVTSPPYYGLRDYGVDGQIGLEETPESYVENMVQVFREARRVLKDDGTLWLNLGDSWSGSGKGIGSDHGKAVYSDDEIRKTDWNKIGLAPKNMIGIPWRVAFALQADGWYLRQDIIWHKPNPMPENVTDRCTKSHEYIFLLSKKRRYFYNHEAIKEPSVDPESYTGRKFRGRRAIYESGCIPTNPQGIHGGNEADGKTYERRNKRDVWTVQLRPFRKGHFATFPPDLKNLVYLPVAGRAIQSLTHLTAQALLAL